VTSGTALIVSAVGSDEPRRVVVLGAGRGSAEILNFLRETHPAVALSVLDDAHPGGPKDLCGIPVLGTLDTVKDAVEAGGRAVLGIANSRHLGIRCDLAMRLGLPDSVWLTYVHPAATVSALAFLGPGAVVYPGARVAVGARLERGALVYYNAVVHHDVLVGEGAVLCAGTLLAGGVVVEEGAYLGIGCVVREGVRIGRRALVGMGAVVTRDVAAGARVAGVPARPLVP
jgi:sugar O-acyltransferase (sialic acid O-acetyltransferase NeuD family)